MGASKNLNMDFSSNDVAWNPLDENVLATGAVNGAVVTWNLALPSRTKKDRTYQDHKRTVNSLCFHPSQQRTLMSCSQDGTMKLFDLRSSEAVLTLNSGSESVRDLQFSPYSDQENLLAAILEDGKVQLWDFRFEKASRPLKSFTAHSGPAYSLDWHPTKKEWIATGGRDKTIKVWNLNTINSSGTTKDSIDYFISTIAPVARVRWQPDITYHIASSCLRTDLSVSVWDLRRPFMPYVTFTEHTDSARGFVWIDKFTLVCAAKDNTLYHHYFEESIRPMDTANPVAFHFNNTGNITYAHSNPLKPVKVASSIENTLEVNEPVSRPKSPYFRSNSKVTPSPTPKVSELIVTSFAKQDEPRIFIKSNVFNETLEYLSMSWFVETALKYELTGKSFDELCVHNSQVALFLNRRIIYNIWLIILEIYGSRARNHSMHKSTNSKNQQQLNPSHFSHLASDLNGIQSSTVSSTIPSNSEFSGLSADQSSSATLRLTQLSIDAPDCCPSSSQEYNASYSLGEDFASSLNKSSITAIGTPTSSINASELELQLSCKLISSSLVHPIRHVNGNQFSSYESEEGCATKRSYSLSSNPLTGEFIDQSDSDESYVNINIIENSNSYSNLLTFSPNNNPNNLTSQSKSLNHPLYHRHLSSNSILANAYSSSYNFLYGDDEFKINLQDALETLSDLTEGQVEQVTSIPEEAFIRKHLISDYPNPPNFDDVATPESPIISPSSPLLFSSSSGIDSLKDLVETFLSDSSLNEKKIRKVIRKSDTKILLKQIFQYLTSESDVQSIVSIVIILGGRINELSDYLDSTILEKWFSSYIELLHRFQLWSVATQVITLSNLPVINSFNQSSTSVKIICGVCSNRTIHGLAPIICKNCGTDVTQCAVCNESVTGLYAWCGGCSHGGHLIHLHNWYKTNISCPYPGCDHKCEYA